MARQAGSGTERRVALLAAALALGAGLLVLGLPEAAPHERVLPWWLLAAGFALAEVAVVHLQVRRDSVSVSFGEIPLVLGLTFAAPMEFVLANVLGSALVLVLQRGQRGLKLTFNLCLFALEAALASTVYVLVAGGAEAGSVRAGLAALAAVLCADLASSLAVTAVIRLTTGRLDREPLVEAMSSGLVGAIANTSAGLLAVVLLVHQPAALLLLLVVFLVLVVVYREYAVLGRGHARLELLYRFTRGVADQGDADLVVARVLREARDVMQSGRAELVLLGGPDRPDRTLRLDGTDETPRETGMQSWWAAALAGSAVCFPRGSADAERHLAQARLADGLAAPLQAGAEVFGVLAVADRPAFLETYGDSDLRLFQSLADHAAVALQNATLVERLKGEVAEREHQALHDARTGLPNRRQFLDRLGVELAQGRATGVLMLDLVGFGAVNDALGHATGDSLLDQVGRRLAAHLGEGQVARLGNDEFAALLVGAQDPGAARRQGAALLRVLDEPFAVEGFALDIRAQAGIALAPEHTTDPTRLLQYANAALAAAVRDGVELAAYSVWLGQGSARRLQLVSDLRDALAHEQLSVHYQPKVDPVTCSPHSAEALVRWTHPQLGRIGPDEFIPLAEHSGLIGDLTTFVLRTALEECSRWRAAGQPLGIAVNLSTRSLSDPELPGRLAAELAATGVPAGAVTLEVTESAVMTDVQRSVEVLDRLRALGVVLSVDDFGTGQSSLAYLQDLPVQELKIDKSFVQDMSSRPGSLAIVRAAIDLGHALGMTVVAEGVEDEATRAHLASAGCDVLQGYLFSRPLPADQFAVWLGAHAGAVAAQV